LQGFAKLALPVYPYKVLDDLWEPLRRDAILQDPRELS
jgi:hypothetical protein